MSHRILVLSNDVADLEILNATLRHPLDGEFDVESVTSLAAGLTRPDW